MDALSRAQWVAGLVTLLLIVASALMTSGSRALMPQAEQAVATPVGAAQLMVEGDQRLAAGDFSGALQVYDEALLRDPGDVGLYYRAGAALSHLEEREQAVAMFLWVVRHGPPEREEVRLAQRWLEAAGVLTPPDTSRSPPDRR